MRLSITWAAAVVAVGLSACATTPQGGAPDKQSSSAAPMTATSQSKGISQADLEAAKLKEAMTSMAGKSIFFDFDDFSIKDNYKETVQQQAELMKRFAKLSVSLEGNADERGSTEYNLALGQKRADAVRKALVLVGVPESRIEAVSFGKEKPRATCPEEKCWSENRRVDFVPKAQ